MAVAAKKKPKKKSKAPKLDRRMHVFRPDLAALSLKGKVDADRYVEPREMVVRAPVAPLKAGPDPDGALESALLFGETFDVYDSQDGWSWGQSRSDGYVGYLCDPMLGEPSSTATHRVALPQIHLYGRPSIKSEPVGLIHMNALLTVLSEEGNFAQLEGGLYARHDHLESVNDFVPDFVATAQMFQHVPYLWGGRTAQGIDCSGLTQIALLRAGYDCPRDSDQQEKALGKAIDPDAPLKRGDLVFWPGHVAMMTGTASLIHANQHHMRVSVEPLKRVRERIYDNQGDHVSSVRRLAKPK